MKKIVVLTGAGISRESGIKTFRESGGLWEEYDIAEVATPEAWQRNPALVLEFYNQRRLQLQQAQPNEAHLALVRLESRYQVRIITQNIDDLHEKAGSSHILHLHGELNKVRSTLKEDLIYPWTGDLKLGDTCDLGSQLRPHIVWFGELVPMLEPAAIETSTADIVLIIGTSMQVYPAASLVGFAPSYASVYYVDPEPSINYELQWSKNLTVIAEKATTGVKKVVEDLLKLER